MILVTQRVIDPHQVGIVVRVLGEVADEVRLSGRLRGIRRQREVLQEALGDRVGNGIPLGHCGYNRGGRNRIRLLQCFPAIKEERLVLPYRSANGSPILIAMQRVLGSTQFVGKEIGGLQLVVASELEEAAVEQVGPALGDHVDLCAGLPAEFG